MPEYVEHLQGGGPLRLGSKTKRIIRIIDDDQRLGITEMWKYDVTGSYRMLYAHFKPGWECTIKRCKENAIPAIIGCDLERDREKECAILHWIGNHDDYDRRQCHGKSRGKGAGGRARKKLKEAKAGEKPRPKKNRGPPRK
ncbi:hypothetical protein CENSYa_0062 [Cenarchaeum symbiosum A]|uniref:Uncharacterized protein n=1 Tax=Cenarchaeum symbiosum (strain A) TaxID=414004 RepID=A0RTP1_CENSY|nr:hypothetical protein CENSYa_0062 [Cenarchaeum symbiosum A]